MIADSIEPLTQCLGDDKNASILQNGDLTSEKI